MTCTDLYRRVKVAEVAKAWELLTARKQHISHYSIVDALVELFPSYRLSYKPSRKNHSPDLHVVAPFSTHGTSFSQATKEQLQSLTDSGFSIDADAPISAEQLSELLRLEGMPPRGEDIRLLEKHGINLSAGDAFAAYALAVLTTEFERLASHSASRHTNMVASCLAATSDPAYHKALITIGHKGGVVFWWPEAKIAGWHVAY